MKIPTEKTNSIRTTAAAAIAAAGFALGGCATTHVGDDWQCPVVHGVPCQNVADADPAGPGGQQYGDAGAQQSAGARQSGGAAASNGYGWPGEERLEPCSGGCRPFGWLRRVLSGGKSGGEDEEATDRVAATEQNAPVGADSEPESLRTPEVIGRIWIAPYVDGEGVYHEASWVREVLQPARWKLP